MKNWVKYVATIVVGATVMGAAYLLPMGTFQAFVIGWLFLIPATFAVYMVFSLKEYMQDRQNRIEVTVKPTEAMKALARREASLNAEKELLYNELQK